MIAFQIKSEIDRLTEYGVSSEEVTTPPDWNLSPKSYEKVKIESKYKKKLSKVMETFIERIENSNSSGSSCSGDEK